MKLHLGCGRKILEGWVNIDLPGTGAPVEADIRDLPFPPCTADEVMAIHVFEHFYLHDALPVLEEWRRVLKPGGQLTLELPCLDKVLLHFQHGGKQNMTMWALYGDPRTHKDGEPALHKWCWSRAMLREVLEAAGFTDIEDKPCQYHQPTRDQRVEARKPNV